jgi:hypothetical protein
VPLADDILRRIHESFSDSDRDAAVALLLAARLHDGSAAEPRLLRCALAASKGSLDRVGYYVRLLAVDYRDVIAAGEYETVSGKLVRVRDCTSSF